MYEAKDVMRPIHQFIPGNIELIFSDVELIEPDSNRVNWSKQSGDFI